MRLLLGLTRLTVGLLLVQALTGAEVMTAARGAIEGVALVRRRRAGEGDAEAPTSKAGAEAW